MRKCSRRLIRQASQKVRLHGIADISRISAKEHTLRLNRLRIIQHHRPRWSFGAVGFELIDLLPQGRRLFTEVAAEKLLGIRAFGELQRRIVAAQNLAKLLRIGVVQFVRLIIARQQSGIAIRDVAQRLRS